MQSCVKPCSLRSTFYVFGSFGAIRFLNHTYGPMPAEFAVPTWLLALSYWLHLLATVVWLGGLTVMVGIAWPAVRRQLLATEQWLALRRQLQPWANASLVVLWLTGLLQMTADDNYEGFLVLEGNAWAQAILVKHLAVLGMMGFGLYIQWRLYPAAERLALLSEKRPEAAAAGRERLAHQEVRLQRLNLLCAAVVLLCTAIATAI